MISMLNIGRYFYGIAMAGMGILTIYYQDLPYFFIPPAHSWLSAHPVLIYVLGALLFLAGLCIVIGKKVTTVTVLLGTVFLLIFFAYFIPYQVMVSPNYMHFGDWENAAKEFALGCGALVIAGSITGKRQNSSMVSLRWLVLLGSILYALTIVSFGINHFLYAKDAADYVPSWIPRHVFWIYFTGTALICSGIAIALRIKYKLAAMLLGTMILIWVIILHIPYAIAAPASEKGSEASSGLLALAYSGIAFVIAGNAKAAPRNQGPL